MIVMLAGVCIVLSPQAASAENVKIAIIDSGTKGYVDLSISFTSFEPTQDPLHHGTKIAKLIRAKSPDAHITMLQVCERINGVLKPSREAVLEAIKWSIENDIDIVNLSLVTNFDEQLQMAIEDAAINHGILFVAAAGNQSITSRFEAGEDGFMRRIHKRPPPAFPSSSEHVISVGAEDANGQIANYSTDNADIYTYGRIFKQRGTSFACARITSKIANILKKYDPPRNPTTVLSYFSHS